MSSRAILRGFLVVLAFCIGSAIFLVGLSRSRGPTEVAAQSGWYGWPAPIYSDTEAISRAAELLPTGFEPVSSTAKLLDYTTLDTWRGFASAGSSPSAPVWLVGFAGNPVSAATVLAATGVYAEGELDTAPVYDDAGTPLPENPFLLYFTGLYYVFDANGGHSKGMGVLEEGTAQTFTSLSALANLPLSIAPATMGPPLATPNATEVAVPSPPTFP